MEKKTLLFITRKYPPQVGGMENMCYHLHKGLKESIEDVKLISLGKKQIHLIWFFPYIVLYTLFNARKYKTILIGDSLLCFLGHISKLVSPNTKRISIVYGKDILFENSVYQKYLSWFLKESADIFVCISQETERLMHERGIKNTRIITPGINTKNIERIQEKAEVALQEELILVTVGRLVKRKGVLWFVDQVMPHLQNYNIKYLIVGTGEMEEEIDETIRKHHLSESVKMMGRIPDEELEEIYRRADAFIMPNIPVEGDLEGFGIVAIEASLHGLIVFASGIEGIKDAVKHNKNGFLLDSGDSSQYIKAITDLYNNRCEYQKFKKSFSDYTREHYSWEAICRQYNEILGGRR